MRALSDFSHKKKSPHIEFLEIYACEVAHECDHFFFIY